MLTRRAYLKNTALLGAACALPSRVLQAFESSALITRAIPKTGEKLPVVGLGSSATFRQVAQSEDISALKSVLETLMENGGSVFDTAPGYGASEEVAGQIMQDTGLSDKVFWATKVNVAGRGGGKAILNVLMHNLQIRSGISAKIRSIWCKCTTSAILRRKYRSFRN